MTKPTFEIKITPDRFADLNKTDSRDLSFTRNGNSWVTNTFTVDELEIIYNAIAVELQKPPAPVAGLCNDLSPDQTFRCQRVANHLQRGFGIMDDIRATIADGLASSGKAEKLFTRDFCKTVAADPETNIYRILNVVSTNYHAARDMQNDFAAMVDVPDAADRAKTWDAAAGRWQRVMTNLLEAADTGVTV